MSVFRDYADEQERTKRAAEVKKLQAYGYVRFPFDQFTGWSGIDLQEVAIGADISIVALDGCWWIQPEDILSLKTLAAVLVSEYKHRRKIDGITRGEWQGGLLHNGGSSLSVTRAKRLNKMRAEVGLNPLGMLVPEDAKE